MIVGLMRIVARVGDGHTYVRLPSSLHQFPIAVASIEGAYRVVRGAGPAAELVGGKLTRIDDTSVEDAAARIRTLLPQAESDVLFAAFTPQWLSIAEVMHGLGVARSAAAARFTVMLDDGTERSADVRSIRSRPDRNGGPRRRTRRSIASVRTKGSGSPGYRRPVLST
ncbi:MAG TPA: hypothetical protein VJ725_09625 [Thermoanaerobaculia bacterium]|nr:hypothetical protein [Thermoanaerobaculia bacterium]